MDNIITEIVIFNVIENISKNQVISIVNKLEEEFHKKQPGYIDSELFQSKDNSWGMVMHWASLSELRQASKKIMKDSYTIQFREIVIPQTVKIQTPLQIKTWNITKEKLCTMQ